MGALWEFIGWSGLTPNERLVAVAGGVAALGAYVALSMAARALFGGLRLRRDAKAKAKGKRRTGKGRR